MAKKTSDQIIAYIKKHGQASGKELSDHFVLSDRAIRKHLKQLSENGVLSKTGRPPKVFYRIADLPVEAEPIDIEPALKKLIDREFLFISPAGDRLNGFAGFLLWCKARNLDAVKAAADYREIRQRYEAFRSHGLLDATSKMRQTFPKEPLVDALYYADVYSIEQFGKTKLGQMLLFAKQSQDRALMNELIALIKPDIQKLLTREKIDAVGFIPPTIRRASQFMTVLRQGLSLPVYTYKITKLKTPVVVPQKTLGKLSDRIENAKRSIVIESSHQADNVLLIDDAAGSGATLQETARQLKEKGLVRGRIIGYAVTGSVKGFDVIQEV